MAFGDDLDAYQGAAGLDLVEKREQKTFLGLSWGEFKLLGIAGVGFFMDAYDLFITSMLYAMVLLAYYTKSTPPATAPGGTAYKAPSALPWGAHGGLFKAAANIGNIVGQLLFGFLGDILGRSAVYGKELILIIIAVILVIAAPDRLSPNGITIWITCFRVLMGIGIGGDYPMSAAVVSDRSYIKKRGVMLACIKSNQGWGNLIGAVCAVVIIAAYRGPIVNGDFHKVSGAWRVLQGLSLIPALGLLYFRLTMVESTRFTQARQIQDDPEALARSNAKVHNDDEDSLKKESSSEVAVLENQAVGLKMAAVGEKAHNDFFSYFSPRTVNGRRHLLILIGTALSWFCVDVAVYGINLNSSTILKQINFTSGRAESGLSALETYHHKAYSSLMRTATGNLIVTLAGFFPGYFFTIAFVEKLGRKPIQLGGFLMITLFLGIFAGKFNDFAKPGANAGPFFVVFVLLQFFMNFGPNSTVFIIPAEVFPTRIKSSAHGLSAASGKVGAIIASLAISPIATTTHNGQEKVFGIFAGLAFLGFLATWLIPESKGYDADEIDRQEIAEELAAGRN